MPCLKLLWKVVAYSFWLIWLIGHNNLVRSDGDGNSNNEDQDNDTVQWKEERCHSLSSGSYFSFNMGDCDLTSSNACVDLIESRKLKEECVYEQLTHNSSYTYICLINPAFEGQVCCETGVSGDPKFESWCKNFPQSTPSSSRVSAPSPTSSPTQPVSASPSMMSPSTLVSPTSPATGLSVGDIVGLCCVGVLLLSVLVGVFSFLLVYCTCKRCKKKPKAKIKANPKREIDGLIVPPNNSNCDVEREGIRREKRNKPDFPTGDTQSGPLASDSGLRRRSIQSIR